jgi:glycosyltransferase involved in cell wall biosynthesis
MSMTAQEPLRIIHVARAPVGGVFRHIADLATAQAAAGHAVGLVCDSITGGAFEDAAINALAASLSLGVVRLPMRRGVSPADLIAARKVLAHMGELAPDVIHGHGAKGGIYGRLIGSWLGRKRRVARVYAPHGGSLHYDAASMEGRFYFAVERLFERLTDALVHVSGYEAAVYREKVGVPRCRSAIIRNGLRDDEYAAVVPAPDARDLLFLGAFRDLKGTDVFLQAIARLEARHGRRASAHLVGQTDGTDRYPAMAREFGIADRIAFHDPMPARQAFALAHAVVVPSRAESMPYVVLEAIAAGCPTIATRVGGIPEIFGPHSDELVPAGDADALADVMAHVLADPAAAARDAAARRDWIAPRFHIATMQAEIDRLYQDCLKTSDPNPATAAWRRA